MRALLVSTYDLGHQPFGLASPAAWLRRDGAEVRCVDAAKERLADEDIERADFVAFHLPMHTATRLAAPLIRRVRNVNPNARICAYGLYAPLNADWLRSLGVTDVVGGEYEEQLATIVRSAGANGSGGRGSGARASAPSIDADGFTATTTLSRLQFLVPDRSDLPPLTRYGSLRMHDGASRVAGYTEASRGCRHLCRHCPVVPVYQGQFRIVQADVVLADVAAQVAAGAQHITFGDPDFFNGPTHAIRIVEAMAAAHPGISCDVTIKVEHLLQHRDLLPRLKNAGCLFITSAVESLDDRVLAALEKGHTRADFFEAVALCRSVGVDLVPTFVPFHPWTTLTSFCDVLDTLDALELVDHVAPIQLAIRLLIPEGSRMLEIDEVRAMVGAFDGRTLAFPWTHPDPEVDRLHTDITNLVGTRLTSDRGATFDAISELAHARAGIARPAVRASEGREAIAGFDEPWYCCAEPNPEQLRIL